MFTGGFHTNTVILAAAFTFLLSEDTHKRQVESLPKIIFLFTQGKTRIIDVNFIKAAFEAFKFRTFSSFKLFK